MLTSLITKKINVILKSAFDKHLLPIVVGFVSALLSVILFGLLTDQNQKEQEHLLGIHAQRIARDIAQDLNQRARALGRLTKRWPIHNGLSQYEFEADALNMFSDEPGYHAIEWVDTNLIVRWAVPLESNRSVIGLNLSNEAARKAALEDAYKHAIIFLFFCINSILFSQIEICFSIILPWSNIPITYLYVV